MMRISIALIGLLTMAGPLSAQGRWTLTLDRSTAAYSETVHDTGTPRVQVIPMQMVGYTVRLARGGPKYGVAIALTAANGQLGARIGDVVILPASGLLLLELAPEFRSCLTTSSVGAQLIVHAGPVIDLWGPQGDDPRLAYGGMAGATLALPLSGRWKIEIRGDLALTGSETTRAEETAGIIRAKTMRRGRLALGISRTL